MNFSVIDAGELLLAVLAGGLVLALPGYTLARLFGVSPDGGSLSSVVVGLATLPALDSVLVRFLGLDAALAVNLVLAVAAGALLWRDRPLRWPSRIACVFLAAWLALLLIEWIDFDIAGKLYQPLTIFDSVKHAATTQAIYDSGAPPRDAFFLRPERSSYYYFFYTLAALAMRLGGGLIDAKAAVGGLIFWTGLGACGLVDMVLRRIGATLEPARRPWLILAVLAAGGLDIIAVLVFAYTRSYWVSDPLQWNEQVGAWLEDILWVPHHVTALIAGVVAMAALCDAMASRQSGAATKSVVLAGIALAAALGLSVWVTLGLVVTVGVWGAILLVERRWRALSLVVCAGVLAVVVAVPQLLDLKAGRAGGGPVPIALGLRGFAAVELMLPESWQPLATLVSLPLNYIFEFGALALGSFLYWRDRRRDGGTVGEFERVLCIAAITGLVVAGIMRSTIFNNDLGWRVPLLTLLGGTVWTIVALDRRIATARGRHPAPKLLGAPALCMLMVGGWSTVLYGAVMMRLYPFVTVNPSARFMSADPATERDLRVAFGWAAAHLPSAAVLQQNPTKKRAFAFGVYGRNPIGVADAYASLYGADPQAVTKRLGVLGPIFKTNLPVSEIAARAAANRVDAIVVTAADPIWADRSSFVWRVKPVYASDRVRIIPVVTLEASR